MAKKKKQKKSTNKKAPKRNLTQKKKVVAPKKSSNVQKRQRKGWSPMSVATLAVMGVLLLLAVGWFLDPDFKFLQFSTDSTSVEKNEFPDYQSSKKDSIVFEDFLGAEACQSCHAKEYELWKSSTHGKAGGTPTAEGIIGAFDGQPKVFSDAVVKPYKRNGKYGFELTTEGTWVENFQVDALVGGGHMVGGGTQTYFSTFPDGTLRFLPFDFIRDEKVWFCETDQGKGWVPIDEGLSIKEASEWPPSRILGAHLTRENCQECHGSQIEVQFNEKSKKYQTRYKSLRINCESCHGPGRKHVELMQSENWMELEDIGMPALATLDKDGSLEVCFRCHALKDVLEPGFLPGKDLEEHYALKFPMLGENPYHEDGRIKAFGYQQNHIFSGCYLEGSMTCVDCHDPHAQNYRDINGVVLADRFDDGQCTSCHASKAINPELHTHHPVGTIGAKCVSCHMPYLQHQAMGDHLKFARSDHTIPIPRPAFDNDLGIENACVKCHQDKSIDWLQSKTEEWYGDLKPHHEVVSNLIKAKEVKDRKTAGKLLLNGSTVHYVSQMAGLSQFSLKYLRPEMESLEPEIVSQIKAFCESEDLDLKSMALASLHLALDKDPEIHNFLADQLEQLNDSASLVRKRWATALPYLAQQFERKGSLDDAIISYRKALDIMPDNVPTLINLANAYEKTGMLDSAISIIQKAIKINPNEPIAWVNLGNYYQAKGDEQTAFNVYEKGLEFNPWSALGYFNLANYYYNQKDNASARLYYEKAIEIDPSMAEAYFNLTKTYIKLELYQEALNVVKKGQIFDPANETGKQMRKDLETVISD